MFHKALIMVAILLADVTYGESITHGSTTIDMDFVDIGFAGNTADTSGYGAVEYNYQIGKYEVTAEQFLTVNDAFALGASGQWNGNQPIGDVSWYNATMFCNFLTSGDPHAGAYQFNGSGEFLGINRDAATSVYATVYVIPTEDEWYKAAYYTGSSYSEYANGTDALPVKMVDANYGISPLESPWAVGSGTEEQNGTYDMMGNVIEWTENQYVRGGSFAGLAFEMESGFRLRRDPSIDDIWIGFRVAAIPEPSSVMLMAFCGGCAVAVRRRFPSV